MMAADVRAAAARVLGQVLAGRSLNQALPPMLARVRDTDRALLQQLCYGTLRQAPRLQGVLDRLLDKPLRDRDRDVLGLLLCGLYQLADTRIPDHAAVSATVAAAPALKKTWARGLCNAVLRRYQREGERILGQLTPAQLAAHPEWLYREIQSQWPQQAASIIAAGNSQPPMTLRINRGRTSREVYLDRLRAAGIAARAGALSPEAVYLERPLDVAALPGFADGVVSVQDEAAQLAAHLLEAQAGERVLDACAAPGGKSCHILELQPALGGLQAMDADAERLRRVRENLDRLGLEAQTLAADAAAPPAESDGTTFDRVLVDAPCSASGVIRRHPDIKALRRDDDIAALAAQQAAILAGVWPRLRRGGRLVYATCSILREENDGAVEGFLASRDDARLQRPAVDWGFETTTGRQLLPAVDGPDGLFYAVLEKL